MKKLCGLYSIRVVENDCKCCGCKRGYYLSTACQNCAVSKDMQKQKRQLWEQSILQQHLPKCIECMNR